MSLSAASTGLAITNPLVLYRALLATNKIVPDPAQHRLAIHLQSLYDKLIDYEPTVEYSQRLNQISNIVSSQRTSPESKDDVKGVGRQGIWQSLLARQEKQDSLALTRTMTNYELALNMDSPKGLMLHGEVGTGKSMLIDLFADSLPNRKKRRWHFSTFMLDIIGTLEQLRKNEFRHAQRANQQDPALLVLARDLVTKSPILFLDEFQLPDRAASKIMTGLMTSFFQLGGVLIATSNRMPEELHKAAGVTYSQPPTRMDSLKWRLGLGTASKTRDSQNMFAGQGEFREFLDVLKARCEVWEMENKRDYRRQESGTEAPKTPESRSSGDTSSWLVDEHQDLQKIEEQILTTLNEAEVSSVRADSVLSPDQVQAPPRYHIIADEATPESLETSLRGLQALQVIPDDTVWTPTTMPVYGRKVAVPRASGGICAFTFEELCCTNLGPADYLTLASTFHTLILANVPILTLQRKHEARRFITLLDALYEARCKLHVTASAGPDELFFPDRKPGTSGMEEGDSTDAVYSETLAEAFQDVTSPFRPNVLSSNPVYAEQDTYYEPRPEPDYTHARLAGMLAPDSLEDDPPNRVMRARDRQRERDAGPIDPDESRVRRRGVDFGATGAFTGEDERFAFKRARSRLWEMCGNKWWQREGEDWWRPLPRSVRRWEGVEVDAAGVDGAVRAQAAAEAGLAERQGDVVKGPSRGVDEEQDEVLFKHGASPFRTAREPPPKFSWTHIWGTTQWGKKAGAWGQGVERFKDSKKDWKSKS